jgi:acyl carrier protein
MELEQKVIDCIKSNIEKKYAVTLESDLRQDLEVDSFGTIMIVNDIEGKFGIEIEETDIKSMVTVADIVNLLNTKYLKPTESQ